MLYFQCLPQLSSVNTWNLSIVYQCPTYKLRKAWWFYYKRWKKGGNIGIVGSSYPCTDSPIDSLPSWHTNIGWLGLIVGEEWQTKVKFCCTGYMQLLLKTLQVSVYLFNKIGLGFYILEQIMWQENRGEPEWEVFCTLSFCIEQKESQGRSLLCTACI